MIPGESTRLAREPRATQDKNNRPGPDAAELYKTPVKDKLRRKLSPYVSFEERDTDLFHMIGIFYNDDTQWHGRGVPRLRE